MIMNLRDIARPPYPLAVELGSVRSNDCHRRKPQMRVNDITVEWNDPLQPLAEIIGALADI